MSDKLLYNVGHFYTYNHGDYTNLCLCYFADKYEYKFAELDNGSDDALWFRRRSAVESYIMEEKPITDISEEYYETFGEALMMLFGGDPYYHTVNMEVDALEIAQAREAWMLCRTINRINDRWGAVKDNYGQYLQTSKWKAIRNAKIAKTRRCQMCGSNLHLEVHHNTYRHVGQEDKHPEDLIVLCDKCHAKFHDKI